MKTGRIFLALMFVAILVATVVPAFADDHVYVTVQYFDNGRMYWRSDTGLILVIFSDGTYSSYPPASYNSLPDNPFTNPPAGHIRPINGFGKIWGHYADVRNRLGWATIQERGWRTFIVAQNGVTYVRELDAKTIQLNANGTWQSVPGVPQLRGGTPRIVRLLATPDPVTAGSTLTVSWEVADVQWAILEFSSTTTPGTAFVTLNNEPLAGSVTMPIPANISGDVQVTVRAANDWQHYFGTRYQFLASQTVTIPVQPAAAQTSYTQAAYQLYERGFMIWRADTGAVLVFEGTYQRGTVEIFPENAYGALPDNPIPDVPSGRVRSINGFGRVWGNFPAVRNRLGYALGPEQAYTITIQSTGGVFESYQRPDGSTARITGYSTGSNRLVWGF